MLGISISTPPNPSHRPTVYVYEHDALASLSTNPTHTRLVYESSISIVLTPQPGQLYGVGDGVGGML